jgi:hypothetical protein
VWGDCVEFVEATRCRGRACNDIEQVSGIFDRVVAGSMQNDATEMKQARKRRLKSIGRGKLRSIKAGRVKPSIESLAEGVESCS